MAGDFITSATFVDGRAQSVAGGSFGDSLVIAAGTATLVNDATSPGNSYYYGTNSGGTKGFFSIPSGVVIDAPVLGTPLPYGILLVDSLSRVNQMAGLGTAGTVVTSNGPGALPTWQPIALAIGTAVASGTAYNALVLDSSGNVAEVAPGAAGHVFMSNGTQWNSTAPKGAIVGAAVGGSPTDGELLTVDLSGNVAQIAAVSAGYVLTDNGPGNLPTFQAASGGGGSLAIGAAVGGGTAHRVLFEDPSVQLGDDPYFYFNAGALVLGNSGVTGYAQLNYAGTEGGVFLDQTGVYQAYIGSAIHASAGWFTDGVRTSRLCDGVEAGFFYDGTTLTYIGTGSDAVFCSDGGGRTATLCLGGTTAAQFADSARTVSVCNGVDNITYSPGTPGDWISPPTDVWVALDILAAVGAVIGGPVIGGTTTQVVFVDAGGNLAGDANFTFAAGGPPSLYVKGIYVYDGTRALDICNGVVAIGYTPGTPSDWSGTAPSDVWLALDRCATLLKALNGGIGP
jgi:hypothetical protein